jgi:retron-type reverse transcriptase
MSGKRQKTQYSLALEPTDRGEAPVGGREGAEPLVAETAPESPAWTEQLMEKVCNRENLETAWKRVRSNKGSPGVDGMTIDDAKDYLREHWPSIRSQLLKGTYQPQPVKRIEIPKPDGGVRKLGVPCVVDRLIQQALMQVLQGQWDPTFSEHSYGFRPGRSAHQAVAQAQCYIAEGYSYVVDIDLERFFDRVNHDSLMARVAARVSDKRVLKLIRAFLNAGVMEDGLVRPVDEGAPQGGPLSPLLSNLLLDDLDKELTRRGHRFCRYADDVRHITWRWIPFPERRGLEEMTLGPTAYPAAKAKRDSSMPIKRKWSEDAYGHVLQGPRDMVRAALLEPQPPVMQAYIPRHSALSRGHRDRATKSSSLEPSTRWAMGNNPIQGGGRGTYVTLETSSIMGIWDRPPRREAQGDGATVVLRGRESRPHGEGWQVS